jgi:hypothetical protein
MTANTVLYFLTRNQWNDLCSRLNPLWLELKIHSFYFIKRREAFELNSANVGTVNRYVNAKLDYLMRYDPGINTNSYLKLIAKNCFNRLKNMYLTQLNTLKCIAKIPT